MTTSLTPYHTASSLGISVFSSAFSLPLQNHCCHSNISKIFFIPLPWGLQNEVRFLHHQNLFLISIYIFLLFFNLHPKKSFIFGVCFIHLDLFVWNVFPSVLDEELFFQGIRKLKYLYSFSFQTLRAKEDPFLFCILTALFTCL